jgi:hypothetical protein
MTETPSFALAEDELDMLVSVAIRRAEILDDMRSPTAGEAWHEVMLYEERLAQVTTADGIEGGVARRGAVRAALKAHEFSRAQELLERYTADEDAPESLKAALRLIVAENDQALTMRFPSAARRLSARAAQRLVGHFREGGAFNLAA